MRYHEIINEGGNIFKDPKTKQPVTTRINKADVDPTIQWVEGITGLPLMNAKLGSTGKKATSGDLDLMVDDTQHSKEDVYKFLVAWAKSQGLKPAQWVKKSGISVHLKTPINGNEANGYVQTDLMFGNPEMLHFSLQGSSSGDSPWKGVHRNVLMASIAKSMGLSWSWQKGLLNRETKEIVSRNPDEIAEILLGKGSKSKDIETVENILRRIKNNPNYDAMVNDAQRTLVAYHNISLPDQSEIN